MPPIDLENITKLLDMPKDGTWTYVKLISGEEWRIRYNPESQKYEAFQTR